MLEGSDFLCDQPSLAQFQVLLDALSQSGDLVTDPVSDTVKRLILVFSPGDSMGIQELMLRL